MAKNFISFKGIDYYPLSGEIHLLRCPQCNRENYILNISAGVCTWCGYNANKDENLKQELKAIQSRRFNPNKL